MAVDLSKRREAATASPSSQTLLLPGQINQARAGDFLLPVGTNWIERDVLGIAEEVAERFPNLRIASCDCNRCVEEGHFPHVVLELCKDGATRPVFGFMEFGQHIIARLQAIHVSNDPEGQMERQNQRARAEQRRKTDEARREGLEVVESALRSRKQAWTGPNGMKTNPNARVV